MEHRSGAQVGKLLGNHEDPGLSPTHSSPGKTDSKPTT